MPIQQVRRLAARVEARLRGRHGIAHAALLLLSVAVIAALGAAAWPIVVELRAERIAAADPRPGYVSRARDRIQKATDAALAGLPPRDRSGLLRLRIEIGPEGNLIAATVAEPSGFGDIDELALRIARDAAPFEPFPAEMRRTTRAVEIISEFVFR